MDESKRPPIDFDEGSPNDEEPRQDLDQLEQGVVLERADRRQKEERAETKQTLRMNYAVHDGYTEGHLQEEAERRREREEARAEESGAEKEPDRYIVKSFAELMIRGKELGNGARVRIWDKGIEEGVNHTTNPPLRFQRAVDWVGKYIDGSFYRVRMPYSFEFDCFGPDLNQPGKLTGFWGGRIIESNFPEWAGEIDLGPDRSGHTQEWYQGVFDQLKRDEEASRARRRGKRV